jgi:VanZ family protein
MPNRALQFPRFRRILWTCLATYWLMLLLAIHWPMPFHPSEFVTGDDKVVHFLLYGSLALLLLPTLDLWLPEWPTWRRSALVIAIIVVQGSLDELTQPLTQRTTDVLDLLADTCGACAAVLAYRTRLWRLVPKAETS